MKLEDQVCNLDLAKRLKELGVKQESFFWWNPSPRGSTQTYQLAPGFMSTINAGEIAAFTVAELGEMMRPKEVVGTATYIRKDGDWRCVPPVQLQHLPSQDATFEADARAKMLIYLLENKLINQ